MNRNEHFIPSLDGLRAVAVALVCLAHLTWNQQFLGRNSQYLKLGSVGVRIFFVLSGFLITGILLRELERTSTLSLRRFYFRRTMRIMPAFYTFVAVMVIATAAHWIHFYDGSALPSLTYTADYFVPGKRAFGHTWSLAVEEQFYLVWPAILLLLGPRRGMWFAGGLLLACPLMRVISYALVVHQVGVVSQVQDLDFRLNTQADALAMGCLLAGLRSSLHSCPWYRGLLHSHLFVLVPLVGFLTFEFGRQALPPAAYLLAGVTVTNLAITLSVDWCVQFPGGRIGRVLNAAPVTAMGVLSYSIYLWQAPFLFVSRSSWWQTPPANLGLTLLAATASFLLIERPCLRLRVRLMSQYEHSLVRFARSLVLDRDVALDCVQNTFLRAYESLDGGRQVNGHWLFKVAHNRAMDQLRRRGHLQSDPDLCMEASSETSSVTVQQAMDRLPRRHREVLYLFAVAEFRTDQIAGLLGTTGPAVRQRLYRARQEFRRVYGGAQRAR